MTATFGTDDTNDLYLGADGNIVLLSGIEAVAEACETATKAQLGEMLLMTTLGIPNFQTVWRGVPNFAVYTSFLRNTLQNVNGVQSVESLELKAQSNVLSYVATIKTTFGTVSLNG